MTQYVVKRDDTWVSTPVGTRPQPRKVGDVVDVPDAQAQYLVLSGQLELATPGVYPSLGTYQVNDVVTVQRGAQTVQLPASQVAAFFGPLAGTTPPTTPAVPVNSSLPTVSGAAAVGQTLTASTGVWANSPTSYSYQWLRAGSPISGATSQTYVPVSADVGSALSVSVVATNAGGSSQPATSSQTSSVVAPSPTGGSLDFTDFANSGLVPGL